MRRRGKIEEVRVTESWDPQPEPRPETYSPWTVVNVVFSHLVDVGLHPILGDGGHPGEPAAELLRALGITPTIEGDARTTERTRARLAELRAAVMDDP
jgi:hypothetical protein